MTFLSAGAVDFSDDFNDGVLDPLVWTTTGGGSVVESGGTVTSTARGVLHTVQGYDSPFEIRLRARLNSGLEHLKVLFRSDMEALGFGERRGIVAAFSNDGSAISFQEIGDGGRGNIASKGYPLNTGQYYDLLIRDSGDSVELWIDGNLELSADTTFAPGKLVGLYSREFGGTSSSIDSFSLVATPTLNDGLVAYYPFNGNADDESGNGNDGTVEGSFVFTPDGREGNAVKLNGDRSLFYSGGGFVDLPSFDSTLNNGFTISLWARDEAIGTNPVGQENYISFGVLDQAETGIGINNNTGSPFLFWYMDTGEGGAAHLDRVSIEKPVGSLTQFASEWKNLVMVYRPGVLRAYLNGEFVGEENITFEGFPFSYSAIGRHWWSNGSGSSARMSVTIDEVRIYDRTLSQEDVSELYDLKKPEEPKSTYQIVEGNYTWAEAKTDAEARGGRLAVLATQERIDAANQYLASVGSWNHTWIGLTDEQNEGDWRWIDGQPISASNWNPGEPNNANGGIEHYALIYPSTSGNRWNDSRASYRADYLLEIPGSLTLEDGLVAYYPFNGNAEDESGNGLNGTVNGPALTSDRFEQPDRAYYFDGSGGRGIDFGDVLDINDGEFTISVWVKASDASERVIIGKGNSGSTRPAESGYMIFVNDSGRYSLRYYDDQAQGVETGDPTNLQASESWDHLVYHLARQGNDTTLTLFVNGEQVGTRTGSVGSSNSEAGLSLGYHNKNSGPSYPFLGKIDDLRIYDRALSEQEVSALYELENTSSTYTLEVADTGNGSVTGAGTYDGGTEATLTASPEPGYLFASWTGNASGNSNPLSLVMDRNRTVEAVFTEDLRDPDEDGLSNYEELVLHGTDPNDADSDADGFSDGLEITEDSDPGSPTDVPTRVLTVLEQEFGSIPGADTYPLGTVVTLQAVPDLGYLFQAWTGTASGRDSPLSLIMDQDQTVGAIFTPDTRDPDEDRLSNYEELVLHGTDPDFHDTDRDGLPDGQEVQNFRTDPLLRDSDSDGFDDFFELRRNFDPTNADQTPESVAAVRPTGEFQFIEFSFNAAEGIRYRIESSTDLSEWATEETGISGEGGTLYRYYSTTDRPSAYFRVRRE